MVSLTKTLYSPASLITKGASSFPNAAGYPLAASFLSGYGFVFAKHLPKLQHLTHKSLNLKTLRRKTNITGASFVVNKRALTTKSKTTKRRRQAKPVTGRDPWAGPSLQPAEEAAKARYLEDWRSRMKDNSDWEYSWAKK